MELTSAITIFLLVVVLILLILNMSKDKKIKEDLNDLSTSLGQNSRSLQGLKDINRQYSRTQIEIARLEREAAYNKKLIVRYKGSNEKLRRRLGYEPIVDPQECLSTPTVEAIINANKHKVTSVCIASASTGETFAYRQARNYAVKKYRLRSFGDDCILNIYVF